MLESCDSLHASFIQWILYSPGISPTCPFYEILEVPHFRVYTNIHVHVNVFRIEPRVCKYRRWPLFRSVHRAGFHCSAIQMHLHVHVGTAVFNSWLGLVVHNTRTEFKYISSASLSSTLCGTELSLRAGLDHTQMCQIFMYQMFTCMYMYVSDIHAFTTGFEIDC